MCLGAKGKNREETVRYTAVYACNLQGVDNCAAANGARD